MSSLVALPIYNALINQCPNYVLFTIILIACIFMLVGLLFPIFSMFGVKYETLDGGRHYRAVSGVGCLVYMGFFMLLLIVVWKKIVTPLCKAG